MAGSDASPRARGSVSALLSAVGVIALLLALVTAYADRALFDSGQFANRAASTLGDDAVREQIALAVTDDVVLPANRDLVAVRPLIQDVTEGIVGGSAFRSLFRASVVDVHRSIFDRDAPTVTLTIANLGIVLREALERLAPKAADEVRPGVEVLDADPPDFLSGLLTAAEDLRGLPFLLAALALGGLGGGLLLARDRRASIGRAGVGLAGGAVVLVAALWVTETRTVGQIEDPGLRAAGEAVWGAYVDDLRNLLLIVAGCGAVVAAAAASMLRPLDLEQPVRRAWGLVSTTPERGWLRAVRALALIAAGLLVVADPLAVLRLAGVVAGILLIYAGVQELLRMLVAAQPDGGSARPAPSLRNALVAAGVAVVAIFAAASLFVATGGVSEAEAPVTGCNGHDELCDRPLDEVVFASTHNSFSAADYPGWLFAQQETGIAAQLENGVRGLLIDTHVGRRAPDGRVLTDLGDVDNASRAEFVDQFGAEAVDAALRVRDSLGGYSPSTGPRGIYMCHTFCEFGARLLVRDLEAMRDFLIANPNEVLVVINQNEGVSPEEFAAEVERAGLDDFVYRGPTDDWPTLGEMVREGGRVVMMAENPPFDRVPWYHDAYAITKETPYTFNRPAQLIDPPQIPKSCEPNRGPEDAPLFLVNHWIDTSPAPRPSNAAKVNARKPLLRRVRECERIRDHRANLIAVDFYETGDLLGAVDELNR